MKTVKGNRAMNETKSKLNRAISCHLFFSYIEFNDEFEQMVAYYDRFRKILNYKDKDFQDPNCDKSGSSYFGIRKKGFLFRVEK